jgi:hypothetical protein
MAELVHLCVKRDITEVIVIYLVPHPVQQMNAAKVMVRVPEIVQAENMVLDVNLHAVVIATELPVDKLPVLVVMDA